MIYRYLGLAGLATLLCFAWILYAPGFSSAQQFDDGPNLNGLTHVETGLEQLYFIFDGQSGPLGRPAALATFVAQRTFWPENHSALVKTNVSLHLATGIVVFLLAFGLAHATRLPKPFLVGFITGFLWLLSPFLATSQLLVIQRMTTLAGFAVFAGLAAYVWGRLIESTRPTLGFALISSGLVFGTALAALSKENGILLPLLALVIEVVLLRHLPASKNKLLLNFRWALLILPSAFVLAYLFTKLPELASIDGRRDFTPLERAFSQPQILWEYVRHLLIPNTASVSPFNDDRIAATDWSETKVALSILFWFLALGLAFFLRHRTPLVFFGLLFFLVGHLLESSLIYLELYFPHRNYVPAFGLYFALSGLFVYAIQHQSRVISFGIASYLVAFALVLFSTTSLWGNPLLAAEIWWKQHPESSRATQFLANAHYKIGDRGTAHWIMSRSAEKNHNGAHTLQTLFTCNFYGEAEAAEQARLAAIALSGSSHNNAIGTIILAVTVNTLEGHCPGLSNDALMSIIDAVRSNPSYRDSASIHSQLANASALIAQSEGDESGFLRYVKKMYASSKHVNHARFFAGVLVSQGRPDDALVFLEAARFDEEGHPVKRVIRRLIIDQEIEAVRESLRGEEAGQTAFQDK